MEKKNLLFVFCLMFLLMVTMGIRAQESDPEDNYYEIYQAKLNYLNELAIQEGKAVNELTEFKDFVYWANYFYAKQDLNGNLKAFRFALKDYYLDNTDLVGEFNLEWKYKSPDGLWGDWNGTLQTGTGQGLIISMWIDESNLDHMLAGGQFTGGLWETSNGGNSWRNITEDEPFIQGIASIFVNPKDTTNIYITSTFNSDSPNGYANGLYYTHNDGINWHLNKCLKFKKMEGNDSIFENIYPMAHEKYSPRYFLKNPIDTSIQWLLLPYELLRSTDGGIKWLPIIDSADSFNPFFDIYSAKQYFEDMAFDPSNPSTLYITGPEAYRIDYNGLQVTNITDSLLKLSDSAYAHVICVDAHKKYQDSIWFSIKGKDNGRIYAALYNEIDSVYTVKYCSLNSISPHYLQCEVSPKNPNYINIGGTKPYCFNFNTGGKKIHGIHAGFHNDLRSSEWPDTKNNDDFILLGTDGGMTKVFNFNPINNQPYTYKYIANDSTDGIRNLIVQGFDVSRYGEDFFAIGMEHNGIALLYEDNWIKPDEGGDYQTILINPNNSSEFFTTRFATRRLEYFKNFGHNRIYFFNPYEDHKDKYPLLFFKPNDTKTLYAGYYKSIIKFNTENINSTPDTFYLPFDTLPNQYILECGQSNDLATVFFISTDRNWKGWLGWSCEGGGNPHTLAILKVEIVDDSLIFTDVSQNLDDGLCWGTITGISIEVNENDTIVYTSFGGTSTYENQNENKKVYFSKDLGNTWHPMADSLPLGIPVNDIQYHKESGLLFLANDVGVYYYDKADSIWKNITYNLPPMSFNKLRFSFLKNKILVSSFAKGVWEADLPCFYDTIPVTINSNKTWNCSMPVHSDIEIEPYATLTIKKEVYMTPGSKIIVKRKGKLIIDGGKITSACGEIWKGIEVWGDPTQSSVGDYQGMVVVQNEGTIENAMVGIQTVKMVESGGFSNPDLTNAGGIVQTVNANFINNKTAISYYKYPATGYTHIYSGFNYFSDFETNESYIGDTGPDFFVKMSDINKVKYKACKFINNNPQHHYGSGIYSINSQYILESHESGSGPGNCIFEDLSYGIYGLSTTPNRFPEVIKAEFYNNFKGIYLSGITLSKVWDCNFTMSPYQSNGYGLYLDGCKSYRIEGNSFTQPGINDAIGIIVNETRPTEGELIYRNDFHDIRYGIIAQNRNRNRAGIGLVMKCNEYDNTYWNEVVTCKVPFWTLEYGIASSQGANESAPDAPAGNLFSNTGPTGVDTDIYNDANNITYYYHGGQDERLYPEFHTLIKVNPVSVIAPWNQFSCPPTNEGSGGGQISENVLMEDLAQTDVKVDSLQGVINILKDGGSTEDMKWEVDMSTPPETYDVYNELMNNSPYISDTVMEAAIEKEAVLPNVMIRDVMVANPHNAKNEELMTRIEERSEPMPEYMKAQILQGRSLVSAFEDLQSEYAFYKQKRKDVYNILVEAYLTDTVNPLVALDSLELLLASENDLSAKYQQAALSVDQGAWSTGLELLNNIPQQFNMTEEEVAENDQIEELYSMMAQLATEGKTMMDASSEQLNMLAAMEASETGTSSVYSRNILIDVDAMDYEEPILLPDLYKSVEVQQEQEILKQTLAEHHYLKVFPNPAGDYMIIEHNLEMENESAYIEISNIRGETIQQVQLTGKHNQLTVDIKGIEPGVYVATLFNDNKEIESVKFTKVN